MSIWFYSAGGDIINGWVRSSDVRCVPRLPDAPANIWDTTFGQDGQAKLPERKDLGLRGDYDKTPRWNSFVSQADGKYLSVGVFMWGDSPEHVMALQRMNVDGTPDTSFGTNGNVVYMPPQTGPRNIMFNPEVQVSPTGIIYVVGENFRDHPAPVNEDVFSALMAFNSTGQRILPFGSDLDGMARLVLGIRNRPTSLWVQADGKIVVAGMVLEKANESKLFLARYLANGVLDTTFGSKGNGWIMSELVKENSGIMAPSLIVDSDGTLLVVAQNFQKWATPSNDIQNNYKNEYRFSDICDDCDYEQTYIRGDPLLVLARFSADGYYLR